MAQRKSENRIDIVVNLDPSPAGKTLDELLGKTKRITGDLDKSKKIIEDLGKRSKKILGPKMSSEGFGGKKAKGIAEITSKASKAFETSGKPFGQDVRDAIRSGVDFKPFFRSITDSTALDLAETIQGIDEEAFRANIPSLDEFTRQFDISATAQGKLDEAFRANIPSLDESFTGFDGFDDMADDFGFPIEEMGESAKELEKHTAPAREQIQKLSSAFGDQTSSLQSLVPVMKQTGAMMEGIFTNFASKTGPALTNFFGDLLSG